MTGMGSPCTCGAGRPGEGLGPAMSNLCATQTVIYQRLYALAAGAQGHIKQEKAHCNSISPNSSDQSRLRSASTARVYHPAAAIHSGFKQEKAHCNGLSPNSSDQSRLKTAHSTWVHHRVAAIHSDLAPVPYLALEGVYYYRYPPPQVQGLPMPVML